MEHQEIEGMATTELDRLLKMANDIANNLEFHAEPAERIADHLNRFWAPSMRQTLAGYAAQNGENLSSVLRKAIGQLSLP